MNASDLAVLEPVFNDPFASDRNISFVAATGDDGVPGSYPALSPNVLAVGGTVLTLNPNGTRASETGWSGSGGKVSQFLAQPTYQNGTVNAYSTTQRTIPDVSIIGGTYVPVYNPLDFGASTPWIGVTGTSLAAPVWAATVAIADQGRVANGLDPLDSTGTVTHASLQQKLYSTASSNFVDITSGNNGTQAGSGYDLVTGRGVPVVNNLIADLILDDHFEVTLPAGSGNYTLKSANGLIEVTDDANGSIVQGLTRQAKLTSEIIVSGPGGHTLTIDPSVAGIKTEINGTSSGFDYENVNILATPAGINSKVFVNRLVSVNVTNNSNTLSDVQGALSLIGTNSAGGPGLTLNDSGRTSVANYVMLGVLYEDVQSFGGPPASIPHWVEFAGASAPILIKNFGYEAAVGPAFVSSFSFYAGSNANDTLVVDRTLGGDLRGRFLHARPEPGSVCRSGSPGHQSRCHPRPRHLFRCGRFDRPRWHVDHRRFVGNRPEILSHYLQFGFPLHECRAISTEPL